VAECAMREQGAISDKARIESRFLLQAVELEVIFSIFCVVGKILRMIARTD
jgi:hypothetical protein